MNNEQFMKQFPELNSQLARLQSVSKAGEKAKDLFDLLCRPDMCELAYINLYSNKGAITKGVDEDDTLDGMSTERIHKLIQSLRNDTYRPKPVKRVPIPKKDGTMRPLGVPSGEDKVVQMAMKIILEHIYEPVFSKHSHGFRPEKSCHTALRQIKHNFTSIKWFGEADIEGFFDNVNHNILIDLLKRKVDDRRFIKLLYRFLKAGYMEDWKWNPNYSGMPQGGVISPTLSNIYLHELDVFMENLIQTFNKGKRRPRNPEYNRLTRKMERRKKVIDTDGLTHERRVEYKALEKERMELTPLIENTDAFKRLLYCRYADDFILGVIGSYSDAKELLMKVETFLRDNLQLTLSPEKTGVQKAVEDIEFLGYNIRTQISDRIRKLKVRGRYFSRRSATGNIWLTVPKQKVVDFCNAHQYGNWQQKKSIHRPKLIGATEAEIVETFNAELRGFANYYMLAIDMKRKLSLLVHLGLTSLFKTLANKSKTSVNKVVKRLKRPDGFAVTVQGKDGNNKDIKVFQLKTG
jgi:RNA-directed DNA polymerase